MTTTTAGALDPENVGQEITIHLPGGTYTGTLTSIHHSPGMMVTLQVNRRRIVVHHSRKITLGPA